LSTGAILSTAELETLGTCQRAEVVQGAIAGTVLVPANAAWCDYLNDNRGPHCADIDAKAEKGGRGRAGRRKIVFRAMASRE